MPALPPQVLLCSRCRGRGRETPVMAQGPGRGVPPRVKCGRPGRWRHLLKGRSSTEGCELGDRARTLPGLTSGPPLLSFHPASPVIPWPQGPRPPLGHLGSPRPRPPCPLPFCRPWVGKSTGSSPLPSLLVLLGITRPLTWQAPLPENSHLTNLTSLPGASRMPSVTVTLRVAPHSPLAAPPGPTH